MRKPYIVRSDDFGGAATIVDRQTNAPVGRVVQDFHGRWKAFVWVDGAPVFFSLCHYRGEAAEAVWLEHRAFLRGEGTK